MDPNVTWEMVNDTDRSLVERAEAAVNLLVWIAKGGHCPTSVPGYGSTLTVVVDQSNIVLSQALDALEDMEGDDL